MGGRLVYVGGSSGPTDDAVARRRRHRPRAAPVDAADRATGRDAADTAFLSVHLGAAELTTVNVLAVVDELPDDDGTAVVALA
jgi:hypothetical protein